MPAPAHPTDAAAPAEAAPARLPQRLRRRLAALGAVGAVMVALPLVQLLRYQNAEVQALMADRAGLDPVGRAVGVQRGLLAHRDLAGQVLRGRYALEPERRRREGEVDERVKALSAALASGLWARAIGEADTLGEDWTRLAAQVDARNIGAVACDQAHGLLIEQTLQVIDLVGDFVPSHADARATAATLALVHGLPRLAARIAALAPGAGASDDSPARERELAATEAALTRLLDRLDVALVPQDGATHTAAVQAPRSPLADAVAAAGTSTGRYFRLLRSVPASAPELHAAGTTALQAQWRLFALAQEGAAASLAGQQARLELQRHLGLDALAGLALLALCLAWRLAAGLGTGVPAPPDGEQAPRAGDGGRGETGRLLQRLRGAAAPGAAAGAAAQDQDQAQAQPTLPPPP